MRSTEPQKVFFASGGTTCAAWHYPGSNGAAVVMAAGFGVTKEPGTDRFAQRFHDAGFTVLAFDFRHLGESGGRPRQVVRLREQLADWQAAIEFVGTLPRVDPGRIAIWGFSSAGGQVFTIAARNPQLAAAIAQTPNADGPAAARNAFRHQTTLALLRLTGRALLDALGGLVGRKPLLVPLTGGPGTVAVLTAPDAQNGPSALNPANKYPEWQQEIAARSTLRLGFYRPGRYAGRVQCPLLVVAYDNDGAALPGPAVRAAERAPQGELALLHGGHYEPFLDGYEEAVSIQLSFLHRHLLDHRRLVDEPQASGRRQAA
jgi:uncharacterized protein